MQVKEMGKEILRFCVLARAVRKVDSPVMCVSGRSTRPGLGRQVADSDFSVPWARLSHVLVAQKQVIQENGPRTG